jgi:hypothetical protein
MKASGISRAVVKCTIIWLFYLVCQFLNHKERESAPRFLGTSKEHGTFVVSYVLMWLLKDVKFSLTNFLS